MHTFSEGASDKETEVLQGVCRAGSELVLQVPARSCTLVGVQIHSQISDEEAVTN